MSLRDRGKLEFEPSEFSPSFEILFFDLSRFSRPESMNFFRLLLCLISDAYRTKSRSKLSSFISFGKHKNFGEVNNRFYSFEKGCVLRRVAELSHVSRLSLDRSRNTQLTQALHQSELLLFQIEAQYISNKLLIICIKFNW